MKHRHLLLSLAMVSVLAASVNGATLLTETTAPNRNNFTGTIGYRILVGANNLSVTALGFQDAGGDGLASTHQVGIWNGTTGALVTSITVPLGLAEALENNFRYVDVTGVTLLAGQNYLIGAEVFNGGDSWTDAGFSPGFTSGPGLSVTQDALRSGSFGLLNADGGGDNLRWGPGNMQYSIVPEPSAALLGGLGLLALLRRRR